MWFATTSSDTAGAVTGLIALSAYAGPVGLQLMGRGVAQISPGSGEA
jgi:hypothetical protein